LVAWLDAVARRRNCHCKVIGAIHRRHRCTEYHKFLTRIDQTVPTDLDLHIICDNYATHKTDIIQK
jgi:hypothetical protein